jgi:hypothetical protein
MLSVGGKKNHMFGIEGSTLPYPENSQLFIFLFFPGFLYRFIFRCHLTAFAITFVSLTRLVTCSDRAAAAVFSFFFKFATTFFFDLFLITHTRDLIDILTVK